MADALATTSSQGTKLEDLVTQGSAIMDEMRSRALVWRSAMLAGAVDAEVIRDIWEMVADYRPRLQDMGDRAGFYDLYARLVGPAFENWDMAEINATADRVLGLPDHVFTVDDRIVIRRRDGTVPTGLAFDTNYWVTAINVESEWIQVSASKGGSVIALTDDGSGRADILSNVQPWWQDIAAATGVLEDILDDILGIDKVDASGWHQEYKFDKTVGGDLKVHNSYANADTGALRVGLLALIDAIRAPV